MLERIERKFRDPNRLEQIIAFLTEGVIVLNEAGKIVWLNESALRLHGVEDAADLGTTIDSYAEKFELRYRNNHLLTPDQYPIARAVGGEIFSDIVIEVRKVGAGSEDALGIHSVRSFQSDDECGVACYVLLITDLTEQYQAEKRFESAFNANPAPGLICRLPDCTYIKVNPGFLEMTGYARADILGRSIKDIDFLACGAKRDLAFQRLHEARTIPQMESEVPLPDGGSKFILMAGEPIRIGEDACMLFTFADLDLLKRTELALIESEERFSKSFNLSPVPQTIATLKGFKITEVNQAFRDIIGYPDQETIGRKATELVLWPDKISQREIEGAIERTGSIHGVDLKIQCKDGSVIDCLVSAVTVMIGDEPCVLWVIQDITSRKRSEDELMEAIEAVMEDTSWFSRGVVQKLAGLRRRVHANFPSVELAELTLREREILELICEGQSDQEMSAALGLSRHTIRNHVSSLYGKIGVNRRSAAVIWARERGVTGQIGRASGAAMRKKAGKSQKK